MSSEGDLNARAAAGETVVPGGTGGKSVQAQQNLAEGTAQLNQSRHCMLRVSSELLEVL